MSTSADELMDLDFESLSIDDNGAQNSSNYEEQNPIIDFIFTATDSITTNISTLCDNIIVTLQDGFANSVMLKSYYSTIQTLVLNLSLVVHNAKLNDNIDFLQQDKAVIAIDGVGLVDINYQVSQLYTALYNNSQAGWANIYSQWITDLWNLVKSPVIGDTNINAASEALSELLSDLVAKYDAWFAKDESGSVGPEILGVDTEGKDDPVYGYPDVY